MLFLALLLAAIASAQLFPAPGNAETVQRGRLRLSLSARLRPHALPRGRPAPIAVSLAGRISTLDGSPPPQLRRIAISINPHAHLDTTGLPLCPARELQPSTNVEALRSCRSALVGSGRFAADVRLPALSPFPSRGRLLAFNGRWHGHPVLLAHIYGTRPAPISSLLIFRIHRTGSAPGTVLEASLPRALGDWGYVTAIRLRLERRFTYRGRPRAYLAAACSAPPGFTLASFPLIRVSFAFPERTLSSTLTRSCAVRR